MPDFILLEDEDDVVSCDDDVYAPSEVSKWKEVSVLLVLYPTTGLVCVPGSLF